MRCGSHPAWENPFLESSVFSTGNRVAFRHHGKAVEPIAGQFVMDFNGQQKVVPRKCSHHALGGKRSLNFLPAVWPSKKIRRLQLEAIDAYLKVLEIDIHHAAAHINLGTIPTTVTTSQRPNISIVRPLKPTRGMRSPISISATSSTKPDACRKPLARIVPQSCSLPPTPMPITTSRWRWKKPSSHAKRSSTGAHT